MLTIKVMFEDVQKAFMEKNPNGSINHPGSGWQVDADGKRTYYPGDKTRVYVTYSKTGRLYTYRPQNNLSLAHQLGLMIDVGYASDFYHHKLELEKATIRLSEPEQISLFGTEPTPIEILTAEYNKAKKEYDTYCERFTKIA